MVDCLDHGSDDDRRLPYGKPSVSSAGRGRPQARRWTRGRIAAGKRSASRRRVDNDIARRGTAEIDFQDRRLRVDPGADTGVIHVTVGVVMSVLRTRHCARVLLLRPGPMLGLVLVLPVVRHAVRQRVARMGDGGCGHEEARNVAKDGRGAHRSGNLV
ncbi:hypothetical protein BH23GEM2_BH23GEM2_17560 [soil metagenome]